MVAKALGGSFKLVMLAPRTVREMTQLPKETQKNGEIDKVFRYFVSLTRPGSVGPRGLWSHLGL